MATTSLTGALRETLALFDAPGPPRTTTEVADGLDLGRRSTYDRLDRLVDHGLLETKKVGGNGRVWWRPATETNGGSSGSSSAGESRVRRLERQRDRLEEELADVFEFLDAASFSLDGDLRFDSLDDRAGALLERSPADLVGEDARDAFGSSPTAVDAFEEALETGESVSFEAFHDPVGTWFEHHVHPREGGLSVHFREVSGRKEHERELERYAGIVDAVGEPVYELDAEGRFTFVNEAFVEVSGYEESELLGEHVSIGMDEAAVRRAESKILALLAPGAGETATLEYEVVTREGDRIPVENRISLLTDGDGRIRGSAGVLRDVSERKWFEETLVTLYESTKTLFDAETAECVDELVVEATADVLDLPGVAVYRHDATADELYPAADSVEDGFMRDGDLPAVPPDDSSLTGHAYASGDVQAFEDVTGSPFLQTSDTAMRGGVFVPMGDHGVLVAGTPEVGGIDDDTRRLVELLATNAEAAYDRVEREVALRENERELERQREHLTALDNLNGVVRDITDAVIDQSTREEVEEIVCDRLASAESYRFAWIGEVDSQTGSIVPRVEAGFEGYLDEIPLSTDPDEAVGRGPAGKAVRSRETHTTQDVLSDADFEPWREYAREYGYRSTAAIPIVHDDTLYGLLGVYADRPRAFDGEEREVIAQLGEVVGHAIAAIDRKQALMSDEVAEIEFSAPDVADTFGLGRELAGRVTFDRAVSTGDDTFLQFGTVDEEGIPVLETLVEHFPHFEEVTVVDREDEPSRFELLLSEPPVVSVVASNGGYLQRAAFEDGDFHVTVHLPPTVETRTITDAVKETYPTAEMVSRTQVTRSDDTLARIHEVVTEDLTESQRTTLETAVYSGFFEWPRDASGQEVAASLDVAPPTFHQHLRKAQRKVFESVFSSPPPTRDPGDRAESNPGG